MTKSGKFQMTFHIDYDREENKIELILESQSNVIRTLIEYYWLISAIISNKATGKCNLNGSHYRK